MVSVTKRCGHLFKRQVLCNIFVPAQVDDDLFIRANNELYKFFNAMVHQYFHRLLFIFPGLANAQQLSLIKFLEAVLFYLTLLNWDILPPVKLFALLIVQLCWFNQLLYRRLTRQQTLMMTTTKTMGFWNNFLIIYKRTAMVTVSVCAFILFVNKARLQGIESTYILRMCKCIFNF